MYSNNVNIVKKGYVFDVITKKLASYELISADFHLGIDEVTYKCKLGGNLTEITTPNLKIYSNENDFKINKSISEQLSAYRIKQVIPALYDGKAIIFADGKPTKTDKSNILITFDAENNEVTSDVKVYSSIENCYVWNDLHVIEADGTERIIECPYNKLKLNDEQEKLVNILRETMLKLKNMNCTIYYDSDYGNLLALNTTSVQTTTDYLSKDDECYIDVTECATRVLPKNCYLSYMNGDESILIEKEK